MFSLNNAGVLIRILDVTEVNILIIIIITIIILLP